MIFHMDWDGYWPGEPFSQLSFLHLYFILLLKWENNDTAK